MGFPLALEYPATLRSPLLAYPTSFIENIDEIGLSLEAAEILDDVRALTISIASSAPSNFQNLNSIASG
jgi:hypothetical protein